MSYPLRLKPRPVERVWGGQALHRLFGRGVPEMNLGESWEVFGELPVVNGPWSGHTLDALTAELGAELVGDAPAKDGFPLLGKWLDCADWLSVQIHPDDRLAQELTGDAGARGKSECWYVHRAEPEAQLVHGWRLGRDFSEQELSEERLKQQLVYRRPERGQFLVTPAGTVHALGPGLLIFEIQQSSDLTYRIYDWGRPRQLHPHEFKRSLGAVTPPQPRDRGQVVGELSVETPFFLVEKCTGACRWQVSSHSFEWVTMLDEPATVQAGGHSVALEPGDSAVLPASAGEVEVAADGLWLRVRRP